MPRISISYRRSDSADITGRIFDRLAARYGRASIFRDIDNIPLGVDFRRHIQSELDETDILVAVIGPNWRGVNPDGPPRLDEENDLVRVEVETGLKKNLALIPVLVGKGEIPPSTQLPASLRELSSRNAIQIDSGQDFDAHVDRLIRWMDGVLAAKRPGRRRLKIAAAGLAAAAVALAVGGYLHFRPAPATYPHAPWLAHAFGQQGVTEAPGAAIEPKIMTFVGTVRSTADITDDGRQLDWASAFVAWALKEAKVKPKLTMDPLDWLGWGRPVDPPSEGCVAVFRFMAGTHVGFYLADNGDYAQVLGGNQTDSVKISEYPKEEMAGCRLP